MVTDPAHILIIDDSESFRQMVATFIKKCLPTVKTTTYDPIQKGLPAPDINWDPNEQTLDGENDYIPSSETPLIADHVENSSILTHVISTGADFAIGQFIGEPQEQLAEMLNLEFFEIT
jgi:hypothetical protein